MLEISEEESREIKTFSKYVYYDYEKHDTLIRDEAPQEAKEAFYAYYEKHKNDPTDEDF